MIIDSKNSKTNINNTKLTKLYEQAALEFKKIVLNKLENQDSINIAFCGGKSVVGFYMELAKLDIPWQKINFFLVDERVVPLDSTNSNYYLLYSSLLEKLIISEKISVEQAHSITFPDQDEKTIIKALEDYQNVLDNLGGLIDIAILSSGEDGHIGALFPNHATVFNNSKAYIYTLNAPKLPARRVTMSRNLIKTVNSAMLFFINHNKEDAYKSFKSELITDYESPNKITKDINSLYVVTNLEQRNE